MEVSLGLPFKQRSGDYFAPPKPLPLYGNAYPTRIAQTGQSIWIRLDGPRSPEHGYQEISVSDEPLRTDAAIVAALSALEGRTFDLGTLRSVLALSMPLRGESCGRRTLKAALGEDGWKEHVRAMKEEAEAWRSRSPVQRQAELGAEALGVPYEEVLRRLEEELRRSSEESKHGIREGVAFQPSLHPQGRSRKVQRLGSTRRML